MKTRENKVSKENLISNSILGRIKQYSFARPNKFLVSFALPEKLSKYIDTVEPKLTKDRQNLLTYNCSRISTPERRLDVSQVNSSAHESRITIAGEIRPPLQLGLICYSDMYEKYLFDLWLDFILNHKQRTVMFQCDYSTELVITQLDQKHDPRYEIRCFESFPISISAYNYDSQPSNTPIVVDILFSFSSFESNTLTTQSNPNR